MPAHYAGCVSASKVYVARLAGCTVFDSVGDRIGKVRDVVVVYRRSDPPRVVGLVVEIPGRRRVFMSIGRVTSIGSGQIISSGLLNVRRFEQRGGEVRVLAEIVGRKVELADGSKDATIEDAAMEQLPNGDWELASVFCRRPKIGPFGRGETVVVPWRDIVEEGRKEPGEAQSASQFLASNSELRPADLAPTVLELPRERMMEVVEEMPDELLADVLEEMTEDDQVAIIAGLNDDRVAEVLSRMQPDDAADLLGKLSAARGEELLGMMDEDEAEDVRMLLAFEPDTAGGLMTTDPIIVSADTTVAEALALIRRQEIAPALGAAVFVTLPPFEPPTGRYLGMVHFQRMLRYPPHERLGTLLDQGIEPVTTATSDAAVSRILASYDLVSVPVVDERHRLVGVVTIDDVLDRLLPDDWRSHDSDTDRPLRTKSRPAARRSGAPQVRRTNG